MNWALVDDDDQEIFCLLGDLFLLEILAAGVYQCDILVCNHYEIVSSSLLMKSILYHDQDWRESP